jgi:hypothetical protein
MLGIDKAFVQANLETKLPIDETAFAVWSACRILDIEPTLYMFIRDIQDQLTKTTLVHAALPYIDF